MSESAKHRYEMVNVQPGYVIVERDLFSRNVRSYFSAEPVPPKEEYREGNHIWKYSGMAQSFQFDIRDDETGEIIHFRELLGLLYYGVHEPGQRHPPDRGDRPREPDLDLHRDHLRGAGRIADQHLLRRRSRFSTRPSTSGCEAADKKILILPDLFGLYKAVSYGEIMIDFGLTSMEEAG